MYRQLIRHMWRRDRMLPNIDLDSLVTVGAFGQVRRGVFTFRGTLRDHGIDFRVEPSATEKAIREESSSGLELKFKLAGQTLDNSALPVGEAGVNVRFAGAGKFLFHADGGREEQLVNSAAIGKIIRERARQGKWERDWFLVTKVRRVKSATLLVSASREGHVDLKAKAQSADLGQADLAFDVFVKRDMSSTTLVHGTGTDATITATFRLAGLRRKLFTEPAFRAFEAPASSPSFPALGSFESAEAIDEEIAFTELGLDDIDDDFLDEDD